MEESEFRALIKHCFLMGKKYCCILTSDPGGLSDEKCTCVNNRCIRSKILGDTLDCRRVELSVNSNARKN